MTSYRDIYDFAAGAGALEGYVYQRGDAPLVDLSAWVGRLEAQYRALPPEALDAFQDLCDATLGRAVQSLVPRLGDEHPLIGRLRGLTHGALPSSADDFARAR